LEIFFIIYIIKMNKVIKIRNFTAWKVASSRYTANQIIEQENINFQKDNIIFDFKNIEVAFYSFVDELIGPYVQEIWKIPQNIKFKNCSEYVKEQIKFVITDRIQNPIYA